MIKVYTKDHCPYCGFAKNLLDELGLAYEEVALGSDRDAIMALVAETGMKTLCLKVEESYLEEPFLC